MPLRRLNSRLPGHVEIDSADSSTSSKVSNDGRFTVQFHHTPTQLLAWFERFCPTNAEQPDKETLKPRKSSNAFPEARAVAPRPRLNIAIQIVGSRGDVQPFIPIAQLLMQPPYGHRVRICTHPVFKDFVESNGIEFFSIGGDPEALMAYMVKNPGLLPNRESVRAGEIGKRRKEMAEIMDGVWRSCIEAGNGLGERVPASSVTSASDLFIADAIIANPPSMAHIHCAEKLGIPLHMIFTMPWSPTRTFHHPLAAMKYGDTDPSVANYLSFMMMELLTWQGLGDLINKFRTQTLRLDSISPMWGHQLLPRLHVPYSYLWSESLMPKPPDWGSHISITGFSFLPLGNSYTPPTDLTEFLAKGPTPVYIGFGSIVVADPQALTRLIFEAVRISNVRAIVSKGWGGVGGGDVPDNVYLIGNCPHDWLFQRVSCVVHHGGAGTTAAGIAAGRPTVVVPFFGDQPFWGQMIARANAGPMPIPFKKMTAESLAASITFALKPEVQVAVKEIALQIAKEDGAVDAAADFETKLTIDNLRCDVCPERLAVWRERKTGAHLSSFAANCLLDQGIVPFNHFKLLRHKHWYLDEGAESPAIGAVAAVAGLFTAIGTATTDYSQRLRVPPVPKSTWEKSMTQPKTDADASRISQSGLSRNGHPDLEAAASLTPEQLENIALKLASKSLKLSGLTSAHEKSNTYHVKRKAEWKAREEGQYGRAYYVTRATGRYTADLAKAGLKAPVALFYNVANGFHNFPSYLFDGMDVRRRDEITGLGSGVKAAGKEFVLGLYDALGGLVRRPYEGAKEEGVKGFGIGILKAGAGMFYNSGAAIWGVPGYTLKGIEKEFSKHQLTKLKAEVLLIRLRQGIQEYQQSTPAERKQATDRWTLLRRG